MDKVPAIRPIEILLVEDNQGDVDLTIEALAEGKVHNILVVVGDGEEALAYLRGEREYAGRTHPDLVLLDVNLPRKNGLEVLMELKADESLRRIPVVMLTTSDEDRDVLRAYDLHANAYICKPVGLEAFIDVVRSIEDFWLSVVKLPLGKSERS